MRAAVERAGMNGQGSSVQLLTVACTGNRINLQPWSRKEASAWDAAAGFSGRTELFRHLGSRVRRGGWARQIGGAGTEVMRVSQALRLNSTAPLKLFCRRGWIGRLAS